MGDMAKIRVAAESLEDGVGVVVVKGEIDLMTAPELSAALDPIADSSIGIVLDLTETSFIDSTGLAIIVQLWKRTNSSGPGRVHLVVTPHTQPDQVLRLTGVLPAVPTFASREQALKELP